MTGIWYATREQVAQAPDVQHAAYASERIDSVLESSSRDVEKLLHIKWLFPMTTTLTFDFPEEWGPRYGRVWFNNTPLLSLTSTTSGGSAIPTSEFKLYPSSGPPHNRIELSKASTYGLSVGTTPQQSLSILGSFGLSSDEETLGTITAAITTTTATTLTASTSIGVGRLLHIDSERLLVTDKTFVTSAQTGTLTANNSATTLAVTTGSAFTRGEEIYMDSERMLIQEIIGNDLVVKRATGGTVLAAHTTATIFYGRQLTVKRGAAGTTAATHSSGATVTAWEIPGPANELCIAYALWRLLSRSAGWARTIGSGDNERTASGRSIAELEAQCYASLGRKARVRAV